MKTDVVFILLNSPWDVVVAVRTKENGYYKNYDIHRLTYGWDAHSGFIENDQLIELDIRDLPVGITQIYEWQGTFADNIEKILIYK